MSVPDLDAEAIMESLREEWDALGLMSYSGDGLGGWYADLREEDIKGIRGLLKEAAAALVVLVSRNKELKRANTNLMRINGRLRYKLALIDDPDATDDLWCAVEGCPEPPALYEMASDEFVCRRHLDYGASA